MNLNKDSLYKIVFETDTKAGKQFDVFLLWGILLSVLVVVFESVPQIGLEFKFSFIVIEWVFTVLFSIEYLLRLYISPKPLRYAFSFWGMVDFLSVIPTYLGLLIGGTHYLLVVRIFRLLRVFRILKLVRFSKEANSLMGALRASLYKISIFLFAVLSTVIIMGTLMYVVEGSENGFTSIPQSIYWAIITITTVGYGDIVPHTVLGKIISSIAMITGYAIIAVPTGIVTVEMSRSKNNDVQCSECGNPNPVQSNYCSHCGIKIKY